jgi:hypothetical protein
VATESGVIDSAVRTLGYNDTVDTAVLVKNSVRLENHGEQHEQSVGLNKNEKDQSKEELGHSHQVWKNFSYKRVDTFVFLKFVGLADYSNPFTSSKLSFSIAFV